MMLRKAASYLWIVALVWLAVVMGGCGGGKGGRGQMKLPGSGVSLSAPAGWRVERQNPAMCSKGDCTGLILEESLDGRDFTQRAKDLALANYGSIRAETQRTIGGCPAIEAVIEYADAGSRSLKVYIHKDDRLVEVSFVTPSEEFADHEPALRAAAESIEIN